MINIFILCRVLVIITVVVLKLDRSLLNFISFLCWLLLIMLFFLLFVVVKVPIHESQALFPRYLAPQVVQEMN